MRNIGLIGTGWIGSTIARAIDGGRVKATLSAIADCNPESSAALADSLKTRPVILPVPRLIESADLIVEAAGAQSLEEIVPACISSCREAVILSVAGLVMHPEWLKAAEQSGTRIHYPSGAIAGLDAVRAACVGAVESVTITTRKPPASFRDSPYVRSTGIDLDLIESQRVLFSGNAMEACRLFPANVNVAAGLSLAGLGLELTRVTVIADPAVNRNIHEVEVVGEFGRLRTVVENLPSENPRTSKLAAFSAIALLQELTGSLHIGS